MIKALVSLVSRLGGNSQGDIAARPLLAGYRRSPSRLLAGLFILALLVACVAYGVGFGLMAPVRMMPFVAPVAVLGGLVLWCLPPGNYAPTRVLEPLFIGFFAALILWPNYLALAVANLPWMTFLRITGTPLAIALLACISISASFRRQLMTLLRSDALIFRLMLGLVGLWTFSILLSGDPGQSLNRYILAMVNLIGIFFVSCYLFNRRGFAEMWVQMLLLMLAINCVIAIWEFRIQALPWAAHIPSFLKIEDPIVQKILSTGLNRLEIYRVKGTATTPLGLGELLGLAMPFAMHFALGRYNLWSRAAASVFLPVAAWVILLTDSRLGFVAGCASVLFYTLIWATLRWRQNKGSLFAPAVVLSYPAIFVTFMAATFLVGRLRNEFWGTGEQQYSTQSRLDQWAVAIPKIIANPIGNGIGEGATTLGWTNLAGTLTVDSYWLTILLEIGVLGFIVFYTLMLRAAFTAAKIAVTESGDREIDLLLPISVSLLNFVIVKMVFSQDANHPLIFMMLGAVIALTHRARLRSAARPDLGAEIAREGQRRLALRRRQSSLKPLR
jgi:hypothetical protein